MEPVVIGPCTLYNADCRDVLPTLEGGSVDSVVCDPPYELGFMGKAWGASGIAYNVAMWREVCRVLKPGGHLLAFGGTRTYHRMTCAIEDAGFEIRDCIQWIYGSGFPKSLDVSKAIDKVNGEGGRPHKFTAWMRTTGLTAAELNRITGTVMGGHYLTAASQPAIPTPDLWALIRPHVDEVPAWVDELVDRIEAERIITQQARRPLVPGDVISFDQRSSTERERRDIPATPDAERWQGWGTALKPANEPIVVARKPLAGTVAANVLTHGTGALNIDACRVGDGSESRGARCSTESSALRRYAENGAVNLAATPGPRGGSPQGRWPANVIHDGSDEVLEAFAAFGDDKGAAAKVTVRNADKFQNTFGAFSGSEEDAPFYADTGSAARFFYCAKASRSERGDDNRHPTVKPLALARYLVRLVTPPGGTVLTPFLGSGTEIVGAVLEGFSGIGIEIDPESFATACRRIRDAVAAEKSSLFPAGHDAA